MHLTLTIILSISVLCIGFAFLYLLSFCLRKHNLFTHGIQFFLTICLLFIIILFSYIAFGMNAVNSIISGLFLGIGLALQPLIRTVANGFVFDGTKLSKTGKKIELVGLNVKGVVKVVGMLHTWIEDGGTYYMVPNDKFTNEIVKAYL